MAMRERAVLLLASLAVALAACVPPAPLSVSGALPPASTTYAIVGEDELPTAARAALAGGLVVHGMMPATQEQAPGRLISVTLADRPRTSGTMAGAAPGAAGTSPGWVDRPVKEGLFAKGRREVRLTIRFRAIDGKVLEERTAKEIVTRKAPAADMARLIGAALRP